MELSHLYPHPDIYRSVMLFYLRLKSNNAKAKFFGWKVLDLTPNDDITGIILSEIYLKEDSLDIEEIKDAIKVIKPIWQQKKLSPKFSLRYAELLETNKQYSEAYNVGLCLWENKALDDDDLLKAQLITTRSAIKSGKLDSAIELALKIPQDKLDETLVSLLLGHYERKKDTEGTYNIAKQLLRYDFDSPTLRKVAKIAQQLGRIEELEEYIRSNRLHRSFIINIKSKRDYDNFLQTLRELGMPKLASQMDI